MSKNNKTIIVLGRGRCGSSVICGVIYKLGIEMLGNKKKSTGGYFEGGETNEFINSFLKGDELKQGEPSPEFKKEFSNLKRDKDWGFKEHRLLYLLPWLLQIAENPHIIMCYRKIEPQAKSINSNCWGGKKTKKELRKSILEYNKTFKNCMKGENTSVLNLNYENIIKNPKEETRKIAKFLRVPYKEQAKNFIDPKMKHYG